MLRIAIIGCGKIADQHLHAIRRIPHCSVVAACDREVLMARQLAERFGVKQCFADAEEMLSALAPDVVHITTPPQSHEALAVRCLEHGSHVYLEKPFTVTLEEATSLVERARRLGLKLTAGHNLQFTLESMEMRRLVKDGFLGGRAVHLESHFSYSLDDPTYVRPLLANRDHWVRRLPGQLFHNIVSHGIAALAEFLDDDLVEVHASARQSPRLRELGGGEVLDDLKVLIADGRGTTAFFSFSTQIGPGLNRLRVCGPTNSLTVDHVSGSLLRHRNRPCKSYLTYFIPPLRNAREHLRNARVNLTQFVRGTLHQDAGMKELIERFYSSIRLGIEPPIPYREIVLTARIMEDVFSQVYPRRPPGRIPAELPAGAVSGNG